VITLDIDQAGRLFARSVVEDYVFRGNKLEHLSILDFVVNTYEEGKSGRQLIRDHNNPGRG